jgi:DNA-binding GntR family transcriptional regulator
VLSPLTQDVLLAQASIDHGALPDRTYEGLRDLIIRGRIKPGIRVRETEMAMRFGVSRTPIREALARLVQDGYLQPISTARRTELVVTPLTPESVPELWGMIGALEGFAVQHVARMEAARRLTVAADLQTINADLKGAAAASPRSVSRLFELQTAFHTRFVYESAGARMRAVYDTIRPHVQRYEWFYGSRGNSSYGPSITEHARIIQAIRTGNPEKARTAVESHWTQAAERTMRVMQITGL